LRINDASTADDKIKKKETIPMSEGDAQDTLIAELETAVRTGSAEARVTKLRQVTDLFLAGSGSLSDEQVRVFDDVMCRLTARIETKVLTELSQRLAPVDNAPTETIKQLAWDDEITVAGPVLTTSKRLSTADLTEIAQVRGQAHLVAISKREHLEAAVTDVLLERGEHEVVHTLATNSGARFSDAGYTTLVGKAESDETLSEIVGLRRDIPLRLLRDLLARATEAVRAKLMELVPPERRDEFAQILSAVSKAVAGSDKDDKYVQIERDMKVMHRAGQLHDAAVCDFAESGRLPQVIVAIALLAASKIEVISEILNGVRNDAVLVPCKAAGLSWTTAEAILRNRHGNQFISGKILDLAKSDYQRLSVETAQKTLRFLQVRATVAA
jgi:uncharacterized protein (DUF2336 family)